jgi:GAF domain-containing protein
VTNGCRWRFSSGLPGVSRRTRPIAIGIADSTEPEFGFACYLMAFVNWSMRVYSDNPEIDFLHEIGERIAAADPIHMVFELVVEVVSAVVKCDSCFVYVLEGNQLILRASMNPHEELVDRLKLRLGQGITGWVAEHRKPAAIACHASLDPRFQSFSELPEDRYEAFLSVPVLCRDKLVGVINVQHRESHTYSEQDIHLISTIGFLIGPEIEMVRLDGENAKLSELLEVRKLVERAKGILQRDLRVNEEQAFRALETESLERRISIKEIAGAIVLSEEIKRTHDISSTT